MNKYILSMIYAGSLVASSIPVASAEKVAVVEDLVFIANNSISVRNISDGLANQCLASPLLDIQGRPVTHATDIVIKGNDAIVTTSTLDANGAPVIDVVIVDVFSCLKTQLGSTNCAASVDLDEGSLVIPCVKLGSDVYEVHMERRGNSSNWEVNFSGKNPIFSHNSEDNGGDDYNRNRRD